MIPGEHVLGFVRLQEAVAASRAALVVMARSAPKANTARPSNEAELSSMKMSKDPGTDRVLEALQEFGGEGGGFVKTEAVRPDPAFLNLPTLRGPHPRGQEWESVRQ